MCITQKELDARFDGLLEEFQKAIVFSRDSVPNSLSSIILSLQKSIDRVEKKSETAKEERRLLREDIGDFQKKLFQHMEEEEAYRQDFLNTLKEHIKSNTTDFNEIKATLQEYKPTVEAVEHNRRFYDEGKKKLKGIVWVVVSIGVLVTAWNEFIHYLKK